MTINNKINADQSLNPKPQLFLIQNKYETFKWKFKSIR